MDYHFFFFFELSLDLRRMGCGIRWAQDKIKSNSVVYCGWDMGKLLGVIV